MQTGFDNDRAQEELLRRRQFMYSMSALKAGQQVFEMYVPHKRITHALEALDRTQQLSEHLQLVQGTLITGPTGSGKTALCRYFRASLPPDGRVDENARTLYVRLQEQPSARRVVSTILNEIRYPFSSVSNQNLAIKRGVLIEALQQRRCGILFVDEAHYLCQRRRWTDLDGMGTYATDLLRELADAVPIALVLMGDKTLDRLAEIDSHLAARTPGRIEFGNFRSNDTDWISSVMTLMKGSSAVTFEGIHDKTEHQRIHNATGGNMRQLKWLISEAVMVTVDAEQRSVRKEQMIQAFDRLTGGSTQQSNPWRA